MFTLIFWREAFERAVKTAAQFLSGAMLGDAFNLFTADWEILLGSALTGAVLSVLTSLGSVAVTGNSTPNLTPPPAVATVTVTDTVVVAPDAEAVVVDTEES